MPAGPIDALDAFVVAVLDALGLQLPAEVGPLVSIPQIFLKQFRDAVTPNAACLQQLVQVDAPIGRFGGGAILDPATFVLSLPPLVGMDIGGTLGLTAIGGNFMPIAAVSAVIDFSIPYGTIVWP